MELVAIHMEKILIFIWKKLNLTPSLHHMQKLILGIF